MLAGIASAQSPPIFISPVRASCPTTVSSKSLALRDNLTHLLLSTAQSADPLACALLSLHAAHRPEIGLTDVLLDAMESAIIKQAHAAADHQTSGTAVLSSCYVLAVRKTGGKPRPPVKALVDPLLSRYLSTGANAYHNPAPAALLALLATLDDHDKLARIAQVRLRPLIACFCKAGRISAASISVFGACPFLAEDDVRNTLDSAAQTSLKDCTSSIESRCFSTLAAHSARHAYPELAQKLITQNVPVLTNALLHDPISASPYPIGSKANDLIPVDIATTLSQHVLLAITLHHIRALDLFAAPLRPLRLEMYKHVS